MGNMRFWIKSQENYKQNLYNDNYLEICKMILRGGSSMMKGIDLAIKFDALPRQHNLYPGHAKNAMKICIENQNNQCCIHKLCDKEFPQLASCEC